MRKIQLIYRYCDVLHRASLHLGKWTKVENKICSTQIQTWSDSVLWPNGSLVKHNKDTYRSDGLCTAAEPGEKSQHRFHVSLKYKFDSISLNYQ